MKLAQARGRRPFRRSHQNLLLVPVESMPRPMQLLSLLSPLRYYHEIGLGIFLKGVGLESLWQQTLAMGALGVGLLALGLWQFRRRVG